MILRHRHRVQVQGHHRKQGTFWTEAMQACGTAVVGGVHPTKAGSVHLGVPVFASAREAAEAAPFDVTVDRKSVVKGKRVTVRVDLGGGRIMKKKKTNNSMTYKSTIPKHNEI